MTIKFKDQTAAQRLRDTIRKIALKVLNANRPVYVYGVVQTVDTVARTCQVIPNGQTLPVTYPYVGDVFETQIVRIDGLPGDRFIASAAAGIAGFAAIPGGGGGGGGGLTIPGEAQFAQYTTAISGISLDGSFLSYGFPSTSLELPNLGDIAPTWVDSSGNIIAPGLYMIGAIITKQHAATTPGLYLNVNLFVTGSLGAQSSWSFDAIDGWTSPLAYGSYATADLPFTPTVGIQLPTDADGIAAVTPFIWQLVAGDGGGGGGGGGGGDFPTYTGEGDPTGVQSGNPGQSYGDTLNGGLYWKATGTATSDGWVGNNVSAGELSSFDGTYTPAPGIYTDPNSPNDGELFILGDSGSTHTAMVVISDNGAQAPGASGNGLAWLNDTSSGDGFQNFSIALGDPGDPYGPFNTVFAYDGTVTFGGGRINTGGHGGTGGSGGTVSTAAITSGVGIRVDGDRDRQVAVATTGAGTVLVEISADNVTYFTLYTKTVAATDGVSCECPGFWWLRFTAAGGAALATDCSFY